MTIVVVFDMVALMVITKIYDLNKKFHNCRLAPTLKGKLMKSSSYGPPPW